MLGTLFVIIAGWYRHKIAAVVIVVLSFAAQAIFSIPAVMENQRILGGNPGSYSLNLAVAAAQVILFGAVFYFIGSGLRALRDKFHKR